MTNRQAPNHKQSPNSKVSMTARGTPDGGRDTDLPQGFGSFALGYWDLFGH
jgi:hypothetical protein